MPYVRTRGVVLRCIEYSESSQVVAFSTPDLGQVHVLAKGSRRPRKDGRAPLDLLTHCDLVLSRRAPGQLHIVTDWSVRETFPVLRKDLRRFWTAFCADEVVLTSTSENPDDGAACDHLLALLRQLEGGQDERLALFLFLVRVLKTIGCVPVTDRCAQCNRALRGLTRFSPGTGGALCGDCSTADPTAFSISRGALAIISRLAAREEKNPPLRVTANQAAEIQRAFNEQIQYHLGRPLRTFRFLANACY